MTPQPGQTARIHDAPYEPNPTVPPPTGPPPGVSGPAPARRRVLRVELAAMAFLAVVPTFVIALEGISDPTTVDLEIGAVELVASLLAALGPAAMAMYLLWRDGRLDVAGFGRRRAGFIAGYGALGWVCCLLAVYGVVILMGLVWVLFGGDVDALGDEENIDLTVGTVLAVVGISLTAGVGEEVVFRAYAITRMEDAGYGRAALWVPWAAFTAVHLYQGPSALIVIGAVAAVFVWLYRWKRSIWPVMVAHAMYDLTILALVLAAG